MTNENHSPGDGDGIEGAGLNGDRINGDRANGDGIGGDGISGAGMDGDRTGDDRTDADRLEDGRVLAVLLSNTYGEVRATAHLRALLTAGVQAVRGRAGR